MPQTQTKTRTNAPRRFTGYHMAAILVGFFGTVMAVNFTMASFAIGGFGGVQVENSYVASQKFNGWLEAAEAQEALGWEVNTQRLADGRISVTMTGPGDGATISAWARQPLGKGADHDLTFTLQSDGSYLSNSSLESGRWIVRFEIADGADSWRREDRL